jgi:hypothetical protein
MPRWNQCDVCGRFIPYAEFGRGAAMRLVYPDSGYTRETWETLCVKHNAQADLFSSSSPSFSVISSATSSTPSSSD